MSERSKEEHFTYSQQSEDGKGGVFVSTTRTENGGSAFAAAYGSSDGVNPPPSFSIPTGGVFGVPMLGFPGAPDHHHHEFTNARSASSGQGSGFGYASSRSSGGGGEAMSTDGRTVVKEGSRGDSSSTRPSVIPLPFLMVMALLFR